MNRFVFIVPFYNAVEYITECAESLIGQSYQNWRAIFVDDCSTDNSVEHIPYDPRFHLIQNEKRLTALPGINNAITSSGLADDDIICMLDGDDKLSTADALAIINNLYISNDALLTFGQYVRSDGSMGSVKSYNEYTFEMMRRGGYCDTALRTFRYKLYKELLRQDPKLNCFRDRHGEMYTMTYDVAMMMPLMEIAGFERVVFNPEPVYYYRLHDSNDHANDHPLQASISYEIQNKQKFKRAF